MKTTIEKKLTKARTGLLMNSPFFGTLALKLTLKPDPATPTAWTDGISLGYNGEVRPFPGNPSPAQKKLEEQRWKVAVFQANQQATAMGRSHGPGFERQLKKQVLARVDWRVILQEFVSQATRSDYAWMHPNPRYITQGIYLPGLYAQTMGTLVVAIDTSGSVSDTQLSGFASEVSAILETYDTNLEVLYADREVRGRETFTRADLPLTLKPEGGGGTDFKPVFELVEKEGISPCCLVYLTDLCCSSYPAAIPDFPVLWVNTERFRWKEPPFGRVIDMDEN